MKKSKTMVYDNTKINDMAKNAESGQDQFLTTN